MYVFKITVTRINTTPPNEVAKKPYVKEYTIAAESHETGFLIGRWIESTISHIQSMLVSEHEFWITQESKPKK